MGARLPHIAFFGVLVVFAALGGYAALGARPETLHRLEDPDDWASLCARPETSTTAATEVVKFLVDLEDDRRLWFVDTQRWDVHYAFARDRLSTFRHPVGSHASFNDREYHADDRRFEAGSIVHYVDGDLWTLELLAGDTLSGERIARLHAQLAAAVYFGPRLRFFPRSPLHEAHVADAPGLPRVDASEVLRGIPYVPLTRGVAVGTLRFVRGTSDPSSFRPDEVVVVEHLPDEIPVVAGVVSAELEAPLGHIAILCSTRGTPNMGLRGALEDPSLASLEGRLVALTVGAQTWSIRAASASEAEAAWAERRPPPSRVPPVDRSSTGLRPLATVGLEDIATVGAKAAQLGEVARLGLRTPGGFVVPFAHYLAHVERHPLREAVTALVAREELAEDVVLRSTELAALRARIEAAPVDAALLDAVLAELATDPDHRWIFRSSTNAEDLPGFTGAGLYRSVVIGPGEGRAGVERALREVWASLFLPGAYAERSWYGIQHGEVAMAVLVQPFVDGAVANGVAITANPYAERRPGYLVNVEPLGGSVTGAAGDEVPEQYLIYTFMREPEPELLSRSSRLGGAPLLRTEDLTALSQVLGILHQHFVPRWRGSANAVDVELLITDPERQIVILQARPYTVRWPE